MFRSAGNFATQLFSSSSSSSSPSASSKRSTPSRRGTPSSTTSSRPSGASSDVGEFGEDTSPGENGGPARARDSQLSQQTVLGHAVVLGAAARSAPPSSPDNAPSFHTFGARRRSSDRGSHQSLASPDRSAPPSSRGSPMRGPNGKVPRPSAPSSQSLSRSASSLGELDLGPELKMDALAHAFSAGTFAVTADSGLPSSYRAAGEPSATPTRSKTIAHSASSPAAEPLFPPPSLSRHARSDSAPTNKVGARAASPIRVVYYASEMTPSTERLSESPAPAAAAAISEGSPDGKGLNQQAIDGLEQWQQDVWVTLRSEASPAEFYANPRTGDCSWEPPTGALVLPIPSEGQWWELCDLTQDGTVYYHHTRTGATRWARPESGLIVPLSMIQLRNLGFFQPRATPSAAAAAPSPARDAPRRRTISALAPSSHRPVRPDLESKKKYSAPPVSFAGLPSPASSKSTRRSSSRPRPPHAHQSLQGAADAIVGTSQTPPPLPPIPQMPPQPRTPSKAERRGSNGSPAPASPADRPKLGRLATQLSSRWGGSKGSMDVTASPMSLSSAASPVPPAPSISPLQSKRLSTGDHVMLPSDLSSAIQRFAVPDFSEKYLSDKHTEGGGFRRRKMPMERVMRWQPRGINEPLLVLDPSLKPLATKAFRIVQRAMGDRARPVDVPSLSASPSARNSFMMLKANRPVLTDRERVLTEVRWLLWAGITHNTLRDELWSQVLKQLSSNPSLPSVIRGWELLCLLSTTFAPSAHYEAHVHGFVSSGQSSPIEDEEAASKVGVMASYCLLKLRANKPARGKAPTILEIETGLGAAFYPSTFGSTLEDTMAKQAALYPTERVPIVLPFLAQGILAFGGQATEGLFRIPGDSDQVAMVKDRIDRGRYELDGVDDVHVLGSLFKLWLRELQEPLVPGDRYSTALTVSANAQAVCGFVRSLPETHRNVFAFLVSFLQLLVASEGQTKMSLQNLALVFAPSIFRCPEAELNVPNPTDVPTPFVNAAYERAFMVNLLQTMDPAADLGYAPFQDAPSSLALSTTSPFAPSPAVASPSATPTTSRSQSAASIAPLANGSPA